MQNKLNIYGVFIGDVFQINYYGINVFFLVSKTEEEKVYLAELGTKLVKLNGENHDVLIGRLKYAKNPYIVKENNTYTHTRYAVVPVEENGNVFLPIEVELGSRLYNEAKQVNNFVSWGTVYAYKIDQYYDVGFERKNEKEYLA